MALLLLLALAAAGPAPLETSASTAQPASAKKVCKWETRIGTLAGKQRVCHTAAEWDEIAQRARQTYQEVQGAHGSSHSLEPPGQMTEGPQ